MPGTYRSPSRGRKSPAGSIDMHGLPSAVSGVIPSNPDPRPMKPPASFRGVVPEAYKQEHAAEWAAANHKERMAMRKAAPRVKPSGTTVKPRKPRKPRKGTASIKPPSGGLGTY